MFWCHLLEGTMLDTQCEATNLNISVNRHTRYRLFLYNTWIPSLYIKRENSGEIQPFVKGFCYVRTIWLRFHFDRRSREFYFTVTIHEFYNRSQQLIIKKTSHSEEKVITEPKQEIKRSRFKSIATTFRLFQLTF